MKCYHIRPPYQRNQELFVLCEAVYMARIMGSIIFQVPLEKITTTPTNHTAITELMIPFKKRGYLDTSYADYSDELETEDIIAVPFVEFLTRNEKVDKLLRE